MKKNKRFIGLVSILIALIILVPVIGLFVMTSPEKKEEQTTPTSTTVSKVKKTKKPKTTKTSESTPDIVKEAQPQSTVDTPTNNQTTTTSSTTTTGQGQNSSDQNSQVTPNTPSATPKFTAQEAIAVAQSYYDRTGLSPSNMHFDIVGTHQVLVGSDGKTYWHVIGFVEGSPYMAYDIAVDNGTIHEGVLYAQGQGNFVPAE